MGHTWIDTLSSVDDLDVWFTDFTTELAAV